MYIGLASKAEVKNEYGCLFRRLCPWKGVIEPPWGSAWCTVAPGTSTTKHSHDEKETFLILSGTGEMSVNGENQTVSKGDIVYLPPFSEHTIKNISQAEELEVLCIWWDAGKAE